MSTGEVVRALTANPAIEGVTLLGGEPFDQAAALSDVAEAVQERGLGVVTFTGHTFEVLNTSTDLGALRLLAATDLLIDGPFDRSKPDVSRPLVGSTNQRLLPLTDRYASWVENLHLTPDRLEIRIGPDGRTQVTGWAPATTVAALTSVLGSRQRRAT